MAEHRRLPVRAVWQEAAQAGAFGAVVGGMAALPAVYDNTRNGNCSREEAVHQVLRSGAHTAVAAGVGAAAASLAGTNGLVRLAAMLVAGGATLHLLTHRSEPAAPAANSTRET